MQLLQIGFCLVVGVMVSAVPAQAEKQALSKSLMECSLVFEVNKNMAKDMGRVREKDVLKKYDKAIEAFRDASEDEARKEGVPNRLSYMKDMEKELRPKWQEKYGTIAQMTDVTKLPKEMEDIMDWIEYCSKLGKNLGFLPIK